MSLGRNDCLGFSSKSNLPCVIKVATAGAANGTLFSQVVRWVDILENTSAGAFNFQQDAALGDHFTIKQAGLYSIYFTCYNGGTTLASAILRNPDKTSSGPLITAAQTLFTNAPASNKLPFLTFNLPAVVNGPHENFAVVFLNSGDEIWLVANNNPTADSAMARVEYLGGAG